MQCKNCVYFERRYKYNSETKSEEYQNVGDCPILLGYLKADNPEMKNISELLVNDTFGCELGIEKQSSEK